jgi:hypothetical protein
MLQISFVQRDERQALALRKVKKIEWWGVGGGGKKKLGGGRKGRDFLKILGERVGGGVPIFRPGREKKWCKII